METYTMLRHFADSYALLVLCLIFLGVIAWAWRPGSRGLHDDAAASIFRNDMKPVGDTVRGEDRGPARNPKEA